MRNILLGLLLALFVSPAWAAMPTFVSKGTADFQSGAATPGMPAGIAAGDLLLLLGMSPADGALSIANENGGTWVEITDNLPVQSPPDGTRRLAVWYSRYNGTQGAPTTNDAGASNGAVIYAFRGVKAAGNPYNVTSANAGFASSVLSITGATTTAANCLIAIISVLNDDNDDFGATFTNAALTNIAIRGEDSSATNYRPTLVTGEKAAAGAYGATTNTLTSGSGFANASIALEGASAGGGTMGLLGVGR